VGERPVIAARLATPCGDSIATSVRSSLANGGESITPPGSQQHGGEACPSVADGPALVINVFVHFKSICNLKCPESLIMGRIPSAASARVRQPAIG